MPTVSWNLGGLKQGVVHIKGIGEDLTPWSFWLLGCCGNSGMREFLGTLGISATLGN
jgi:hypothetical protein